MRRMWRYVLTPESAPEVGSYLITGKRKNTIRRIHDVRQLVFCRKHACTNGFPCNVRNVHAPRARTYYYYYYSHRATGVAPSINQVAVADWCGKNRFVLMSRWLTCMCIPTTVADDDYVGAHLHLFISTGQELLLLLLVAYIYIYTHIYDLSRSHINGLFIALKSEKKLQLGRVIGMLLLSLNCIIIILFIIHSTHRPRSKPELVC